MPLQIIRADITKLEVDAIVNAANESLLGGGGVDGAIHRAAGPGLLEECRLLGGCKTGDAKITKGYDLPAKFVIHAVGPVWHGGDSGEVSLLASCYRKSLALAVENGLESIAFPLISSGAYGFPKDQALLVAQSVIRKFLIVSDMLVYIVVFDKKAFVLSESVFSSVKAYIDDNYVDVHELTYGRNLEYSNEDSQMIDLNWSRTVCRAGRASRKLKDVVDELDETFSESLLRLIDQKEMTDVDTYKKANVDRKLFSKIRNDKFYKPKKSTVIAFAIALELSLDETKDLLLKAGYGLSKCSKFDVIIEYFIVEGVYDIMEINSALFEFEETLLGI
ncbi:MAG: putative phosphatase C-terminal domain of histone macro H2A1 like protein [Fusobacteria bacterium]|nr:MAG: putative phosphatase C-terminal domain of histone macro H2A1 like protein [Fusobacteriota bacterium]KAF0228459.1 MAG: putative phosphatase C-terminal domain of histone macro H2A1 like [Fusobacteriota bacterium]